MTSDNWLAITLSGDQGLGVSFAPSVIMAGVMRALLKALLRFKLPFIEAIDEV